MKEHPILFNPEMVQAILERKKTQTRRVSIPKSWEVGDRLWVRETFSHRGEEFPTLYRATYPFDLPPVDYLNWTASIHMPRSLSRITLEIINVWEHRLGDISEHDCVMEGFPMRMDFVRAWDKLVKPEYRWDRNPLVYAISFMVLPQ
jgi:hypothetical protein